MVLIVKKDHTTLIKHILLSALICFFQKDFLLYIWKQDLSILYNQEY